LLVAWKWLGRIRGKEAPAAAPGLPD